MKNVEIMVLLLLLLVITSCKNKDLVKANTDVMQKTEITSKKSEIKPGKTLPVGTVISQKANKKKLSQEKLSASHILIMHKESKRSPKSITRTKGEAKKIAAEIYAKVDKGADFAKLAEKYSDCPSGKRRGGDLGIFPEMQMDTAFIDGLKTIKDGEITQPVESTFGFHIIKRQNVEKKIAEKQKGQIRVKHILIMHKESKRKPSFITRTKDEAKKLIDEILQKLTSGGDFTKLAKEYSDCPSGKRNGGDLGTFGKGRMSPPFEKSAFALKENEMSKVVETDFGFHIIKKIPFDDNK